MMGIFDKIFKSKQQPVKWYKVFDSETEANNVVHVNKAVTVQVEKMKICLARTVEGYFAVEDTCPHLGASLSKGVCNGFGEVVCPWHSYRFNLKSGHETSGQGTGLGIQIYKVEWRENGLYIGI